MRSSGLSIRTCCRICSVVWREISLPQMGQCVDGIHIGALHLVEKLARVGGKGLHIAPLALGVDGVESQGGLAGTA